MKCRKNKHLESTKQLQTQYRLFPSGDGGSSVLTRIAEFVQFRITASRPGSSLRSACRGPGSAGCTCCGSPGVRSPLRGVQSEPLRPWVCFPTCIRGKGQWGLPGPADSSPPLRNVLCSRMLPVSGNWVDFTGLQKETDHLSVSWNTHNEHHTQKSPETLYTLEFSYIEACTEHLGQPGSGVPLSVIQIVFTFSSSHVQGRPRVVVPLLHVHGRQRKPGLH